MEFDTEQTDAAIDFVIRHGAENRGQTVYYTQVFEAAELSPPQDLTRGEVSNFMERFHYRLEERGLPPLDALVVVVAGERAGFPGSGYFRVNGIVDPVGDLESASDDEVQQALSFWESQRAECDAWGRSHRRATRS